MRHKLRDTETLGFAWAHPIRLPMISIWKPLREAFVHPCCSVVAKNEPNVSTTLPFSSISHGVSPVCMS